MSLIYDYGRIKTIIKLGLRFEIEVFELFFEAYPVVGFGFLSRLLRRPGMGVILANPVYKFFTYPRTILKIFYIFETKQHPKNIKQFSQTTLVNPVLLFGNGTWLAVYLKKHGKTKRTRK